MYDKLLKLKNNKIARFMEKLQGTILFICGILTVCTIFSTVIARYIFKTDLYGMEEVILVVAFWLYFIGCANGSMEDSQIKADMLEVYIKNHNIKYKIKSFAKLIETIALGLFAKLGVDLVILNLERMPRTTGLKIPYVVSQSAIAVGFILMTIYSLYYCLLFYAQSKNNLDGGE